MCAVNGYWNKRWNCVKIKFPLAFTFTQVLIGKAQIRLLSLQPWVK